MESILHNSIEYLKGVGPSKAGLIRSELGVSTFLDLLHLFPNRYIDRTKYYNISELASSSTEVQLFGKITSMRFVQGKVPSQNRLVATFSDDTGAIELVWFKGIKWFSQNIQLNTPYVVFGRCTSFMGSFSIAHPDIETPQEHKGNIHSGIIPVYPSTEKLTRRGISQRVLRGWVESVLLQALPHICESLDDSIVSSLNLLGKRDALLNIHFPQSNHLLSKAQFRLKFEELFFIQLQLVQKNLNHKKKVQGFVFDVVGKPFNDFYNHHLPFSLTGAQKRVLREIRADLKTGAQMNRLLQGDVGSGKTIVALFSMLIALGNGYQAAMLAPTEILASQHFESISSLIKDTDIKVALLTGSTKTKERREIHQGLSDGSLGILIGTHAIIQDSVVFKNLGLAVIDEQHRFGVEQRSKLWLKNSLPPHVLVMSATPIPRTLAMSLYGDLDVSIIDELPPGRKPIKTIHSYEKSRQSIYSFIAQQISQGRQAYIVYPLIKESEALDYKNLYDGYQMLKHYFPSPSYSICIVHGQLTPQQKREAMDSFVSGESQIMVATTVIEVGVNVPNASVMVIESAQRFGLSQLHQLRGRVGRGSSESYCILLTDNKLSSQTRIRMETMTSTDNGFEIAEVDLKLRGPGDISGTQQSGVLNLKIANLAADGQILKVARDKAIELFTTDSTLGSYPCILRTLSRIRRSQNIWNLIS